MLFLILRSKGIGVNRYRSGGSLTDEEFLPDGLGDGFGNDTVFFVVLNLDFAAPGNFIDGGLHGAGGGIGIH